MKDDRMWFHSVCFDQNTTIKHTGEKKPQVNDMKFIQRNALIWTAKPKNLCNKQTIVSISHHNNKYFANYHLIIMHDQSRNNKFIYAITENPNNKCKNPQRGDYSNKLLASIMTLILKFLSRNFLQVRCKKGTSSTIDKMQRQTSTSDKTSQGTKKSDMWPTRSFYRGYLNRGHFSKK